jgi:hypothetical protein
MTSCKRLSLHCLSTGVISPILQKFGKSIIQCEKTANNELKTLVYNIINKYSLVSLFYTWNLSRSFQLCGISHINKNNTKQ